MKAIVCASLIAKASSALYARHYGWRLTCGMKKSSLIITHLGHIYGGGVCVLNHPCMTAPLLKRLSRRSVSITVPLDYLTQPKCQTFASKAKFVAKTITQFMNISSHVPQVRQMSSATI